MRKNPLDAWSLFIFWTWVMFAIGLLLLAVHSVDAQTWDWSPPAPRHAAVCRVESGNRTGSGIYVKYGDLRGVLTVAHIPIGEKVTVEFSDGQKVTGKFVKDEFGHDIAFVFVNNLSVTPVPMAEQDPLHGDRVELVTKGGPEHRLRTFWGTKQDAGTDITKYNCDILSGDSGGGILNTQGELIGIMAFGRSGRIRGLAWNAYHGAGGVSCGRIRNFLKRISNSKFRRNRRNPKPKGKCGPEGCPGEQSPGGGSQFYPPAQKPPGPAAQPPAQLPNTPPGLSIDYDKLVEKILAKINPEDFRGPMGPVGPAGETGLRGGPGLKGRNGPMGPPGAAEVIDMNDLIKRINERIKGSIRVRVQPILPKRTQERSLRSKH